MDKNQGYAILKAVMLENGRGFALGEHPTAPSRYVTWACYDDKDTIEWLKGETDEYETDITDKKELQIRDAMGDILKQLPLDLSKKEDAFSKDLLLLMLKQYNLFLESFQFACKNYKGNTNEADIAKVMGFESNDEYNEIMFLREITHTVNAFNDMADIVRLYSKKPEMAEQRLENLLSEVLYEDSDSV